MYFLYLWTPIIPWSNKGREWCFFFFLIFLFSGVRGKQFLVLISSFLHERSSLFAIMQLNAKLGDIGRSFQLGQCWLAVAIGRRGKIRVDLVEMISWRRDCFSGSASLQSLPSSYIVVFFFCFVELFLIVISFFPVRSIPCALWKYSRPFFRSRFRRHAERDARILCSSETSVHSSRLVPTWLMRRWANDRFSNIRRNASSRAHRQASSARHTSTHLIVRSLLLQLLIKQSAICQKKKNSNWIQNAHVDHRFRPQRFSQ